MVDFNNEGTVATAPQDLLKILVLEKRDVVICSIVEHNKNKSQGVGHGLNVFRSNLIGLWYELKPMLLNSVMQKEQIGNSLLTISFLEKLEVDLFNGDELLITNLFNILNNYLYKKGFIKVDVRKSYDSSRASVVNRVKGL